MLVHTPPSPQKLADILKELAGKATPIEVFGNRSKRLWGGPLPANAQGVCTLGLNGVLQYERNDLTVSVQAGMNFGQLQSMLARNGQMIALDPPCWQSSTVGGVLAANLSGPLRRGYGTARDLVIGMEFATLEGKLIRTGGMVVKNVAGLDTAKLIIGSLGTLAVITSANFRVHPKNETTVTFLFTSPEAAALLTRRDAVLQSYLRPIAIDLLNPPASARVGLRSFVLAVRAGGSRAVLDRFRHELSGADLLQGRSEEQFWDDVREYTPSFLARQSEGIVLRTSSRLTEIGDILQAAPGPAISRCASGVAYLYLSSWTQGRAFLSMAAKRSWRVIVEAGDAKSKDGRDLSFGPSHNSIASTAATMKSIKSMFDPMSLLNRSRLYGTI